MNLWDSNAVSNYVASSKWSNERKNIVLIAYRDWLESNGFKWTFESYPITSGKLPFVPTEKAIDKVIAGFRTSEYGPFLQLIKETAFRSEEVTRLRTQDFDLERRVVTLNNPAKHSSPRQAKISEKLIAMLIPLLRERPTSERVWSAKTRTALTNIRRIRKRLAVKMGEPDLVRVTPTAIRHWKATVTYHSTKDLLFTKAVMGHKDIKSTLVYTHLVNFESDEFYSAIARTLEEARNFVEAGFEYVTEMDSVKLFRKRK